MYRQISECRICKNTQLVEVLDLGVQTLTGVFPRTRAQEVTAGPLKLGEVRAATMTSADCYSSSTLTTWASCMATTMGTAPGLNSSMVAHLHGKVRRILERVTLTDDALDHRYRRKRQHHAAGVSHARLHAGRRRPHRCEIPEVLSVAHPTDSGLLLRGHGSPTLRRAQGRRRHVVLHVLRPGRAHDVHEGDRRGARRRWRLGARAELACRRCWSGTRTTPSATSISSTTRSKQIKWMTDRLGLKIIDVEFNDINGGSFSLMVAKQASTPCRIPAGERHPREGDRAPDWIRCSRSRTSRSASPPAEPRCARSWTKRNASARPSARWARRPRATSFCSTAR